MGGKDVGPAAPPRLDVAQTSEGLHRLWWPAGEGRAGTGWRPAGKLKHAPRGISFSLSKRAELALSLAVATQFNAG